MWDQHSAVLYCTVLYSIFPSTLKTASQKIFGWRVVRLYMGGERGEGSGMGGAMTEQGRTGAMIEEKKWTSPRPNHVPKRKQRLI